MRLILKLGVLLPVFDYTGATVCMQTTGGEFGALAKANTGNTIPVCLSKIKPHMFTWQVLSAG